MIIPFTGIEWIAVKLIVKTADCEAYWLLFDTDAVVIVAAVVVVT